MSTGIKQAEGYVQLLMQEGKLEQEIIDETSTLFDISRADVSRLIYAYKIEKPEQYKENVAANIKHRLLLMIPLIFYVAVYIAFSIDTESLFFLPLIILLGLSILGLISYCVALLLERFSLKEKFYKFAGNKVGSNAKEGNQYAIATFAMLIFAIVMSYQYQKKAYLYSDAGLTKMAPLILSKDCSLEKTYGKNSYSYYSFHFTGYETEFRWKFSMHYHAFNFSHKPNVLLKKGDTVSIYIKQKDLQSSTNNVFLSDIEQDGKRWINQELRNGLAKRESERMLFILYGIVAAIILTAKLRRTYSLKKIT